jgi:hypothetical protein
METNEVYQKFDEYLEGLYGKYVKVPPNIRGTFLGHVLDYRDSEIGILWEIQLTNGVIPKIYSSYMSTELGLKELMADFQIDEFAEYFTNSELYKALTGSN